MFVYIGFSYNDNNTQYNSTVLTDKQLQLEDTITPLERQLYFTTAHAHFKAGCPALALEVLNKLPSKVTELSSSNSITTNSFEKTNKIELISTGTIDWSEDRASSFDWGAQLSSKNADDGLKLLWDEEENNKECSQDEFDRGLSMKSGLEADGKSEQSEDSPTQGKLDIMAQQLKFVACLKILMEELSTLATGFEVDGGQLRYQLYVWLEREVDALKQLCNYCNSENEAFEPISIEQTEKDNNLMQFNKPVTTEKPTLHEILIQERQDFEAKVKRAAKRKRWLKANETLLRTLLSYCSLHGASGGGLASVRMELVLLLQELQQEKTQQQLLSPLPFPTTLPLLSACVAGNKTVIADPIKYLQSHTQDMLQTIIDFRTPLLSVKENTFSEVFVLKDLAVALSSCIYQSLCDSESFTVHKNIFNNSGYQSPGIENIANMNSTFQCSHLMANANIYNRKRKYSVEEQPSICTQPSKWPGVSNLRALLAREKDEDVPRLTVLLLEAFVAIYMSLLVYALATCDCHILYRLVSQSFSNNSWSTLFGGGVKKLLRKATTSQSQPIIPQSLNSNVQSQDVPDDAINVWNTVTSSVTSLTKQRVKLNMKILGQFGGNYPTRVGSNVEGMKEDKPTYREQFISPEMSMVSYFLMKPHNIGKFLD